MKMSSLLRVLIFMIGGQFLLSALGVYNPSLWFLSGWILCLIDYSMESNSLRW